MGHCIWPAGQDEPKGGRVVGRIGQLVYDDTSGHWDRQIGELLYVALGWRPGVGVQRARAQLVRARLAPAQARVHLHDPIAVLIDALHGDPREPVREWAARIVDVTARIGDHASGIIVCPIQVDEGWIWRVGYGADRARPSEKHDHREHRSYQQIDPCADHATLSSYAVVHL